MGEVVPHLNLTDNSFSSDSLVFDPGDQKLYYVRSFIEYNKGRVLGQVFPFELRPFRLIIDEEQLGVSNDSIILSSFLAATSDDYDGVLEHGHIVSESPDPTLDTPGALIDSFGNKPNTDQNGFVINSVIIANFNTKYFVRSYVVTDEETVYSRTLQVETGGGWKRVESIEYPAFAFGIGEAIGDNGFIGMGAEFGGDEYALWKIEPDGEGYKVVATEQTSTTWELQLGQNARIDGMSFTFGNNLYFGFGSRATPIDSTDYGKRLEAYSVPSNLWSTPFDGQFFPGIGRDKGFGVNVDGTAYVGLGRDEDDSTVINDIWTYSPSAGWSQNPVTSSPYPSGGEVYGMSAVALGDTLYLIGGNDNGPTNRFYRYTAATGWSQLAMFDDARYDGVAFTLGGKIYYGTGTGGNLDKLYSDFWVYDPRSESWSPLPQSEPFPGVARYGAVSYVVNGRAFVAAGQDA